MSEQAASPVNASPSASQQTTPAAELPDFESKEDLQFQAIQRKLTVGAADDPLEDEADQMADKVMRMPEPSFVQRKCASCEEEDRVRLKPQSFAQVKAEPVSAGLSQQINDSKGNGAPLPEQTRSFMESRFDTGFSDVRIHTDDSAVQMSRDLNAQAFAVGRDIYFNAGKFQPESETGKHLLAHELTHTVQQRNSTQMVSRDITETNVNFKSFDQLMHMTVTQFVAYVQSQADWFTNPALSEEQRERARLLLLFVNDDIAATFGYVGMWYFNILLNQVSSEQSDANAEALRTYASAMSGPHMPFTMSPTTRAVTTAISMGTDMVKLRREFQDYVLHDALNEAQFLRLRQLGFIDNVIDYHHNASQTPTFQSSQALDFVSFISYNQETSAHPLMYESTPLRGRIRNFHRFEKTALDRLVTNYGDTSKSKPLTLIMHTALDYSGAFRRDSNLTAVVTDNRMLTLMIEGFEHLADYQAHVSAIATTYGQNNLIDQVMFAGHGNVDVVGMAGSIRENPNDPGHIEEVSQDLRIGNGDPAVLSLLQEVRRFMDNPQNGAAALSPHNRVVFNACLTGSNAVSQAITAGDVPGAQAEIISYINAHPSIATFMQNLGGPSLHSVGSNASFGAVGLLNPAGELDIISAEDQHMTHTKLIYTREGTEPTGALRAALESWAHDAAATTTAMQTRVGRPAEDWNARMIKRAYEIILANYMADAEHFRLIGHAVELFAEMRFESFAHVGDGTLGGFHAMTGLGINADVANLISSEVGTPEWNVTGTQLALLQVWMVVDAAKQADFMTKVGTLTCNAMIDYVDISFLAANNLMSTLLNGGAAAGAKLRLALLGILGENDDADARTYLTGLLNGGQHFPAGTDLTGALGGASTEMAILTKLGVFAAPVAGGGVVAGASQRANVHTAGAATNTVFVERFNTPGVVENPYGADVREAPDTTSTLLAELNTNDPVDIVGRMADWYAIDFVRNGAHTTAYISRWAVRTLNAYIF